MNISKGFITIALFLYSVLLFPQGIITVKQDGTGDYTSIQQAYNSANSNDTILVYPGRYFENVNFNRDIDCILSSLYIFSGERNDIVNTIIDGNQNGPCIYIYQNSFSNIFIGLTLTNGNGYFNTANGGGILSYYSSPSIYNCIIEYNNADVGAGISQYYGTMFLSGTTIRHNSAFNGPGGLSVGIDGNYVFDSINRCNIYLNNGSMADIANTLYSPYMSVYVDTFTVLHPDAHFVTSLDTKSFPIDNISIDIQHAKLQPVYHDLYVNPQIGNDTNSGLSWEEPLRTLGFAIKLIASDSIDPHTVFLANGVYGPNTNGDHFSLGCRSFVNIIGESRDSVILDADSLSRFFHGHSLMRHFKLKNMTMIHGEEFSGLLNLRPCENVTIENITIRDNAGIGNIAFVTSYSDSVLVRNLTIRNIVGGAGGMSNTIEDKARSFRVENLLVDNIMPEYPVPEEGGGNGFGFGGDLGTPGFFSGTVKNMQITNVLTYSDPIWGSGLASGLNVSGHIDIDIVNATIGDNTLRRGPKGVGIGLEDGPDVSFYNSILYGDSLLEISMSPEPVTLDVSYSDVEGGAEDVLFMGPGHTLNWLEGNIDADPLWAGTQEAPYALTKNSPCIDAGVPMYEVGMNLPYIKHENGKYVLYMFDGDTLHLPATDLAGNSRIVNDRIDMGAYEYDPDISIEDNSKLKTQNSKLLECWPNAFRYSTNISYVQKEHGSAIIRVYDLGGRCVKTLMDTKGSPGEGTIVWNGKDQQGNELKAGTYIISLIVNGQEKEALKIIKK